MTQNNLTLWDKQEVPFNFFAKTHPLFLKIFNIKNQSVKDLFFVFFMIDNSLHFSVISS